MADTDKPHLLLVRPKSAPLPDSVGVIEDETTRLLSMHFRVSVIAQDFDYARVCDAIKPDLVIFDSPGLTRMFAPAIINAQSHPHIPRAGFMHQDPHDTARVEFLRWMDELKVIRIFVCGTAALRQSPDMVDRCFVLPLYCDTSVFYDRQLEKTTPVTALAYKLTPEFYTWRDDAARLISEYIPTLLYIHPGYTHPVPAHRYPIAWDMYARMIGRSHFSLSDTTRLDYLVRKHLDIPACGTILVSSNTPELGFYGFADMKNCILGSGNELVDKIAYVSSNPELYRSICRAGHDLVHSRYRMEQWTGIADWFACFRNLKPGEEVQQQGVFGEFTAVPKVENIRH